MSTSGFQYFVVGDTFSGMTKSVSGILTETEALERVLATDDMDLDVVFYAQQGVDFRSLSAAVDAFNAVATDGRGRYRVVASACAARATRRLAHKARAENILISSPRRRSAESFEMDLCFSAQNEFFLDHMTGMHIQGMVLIEAARQAFLAVTEAFFLRDDPRDYYFVIKGMDASFQSFVFPLDALLRYDITRASHKEDRHSFDADITILQADAVCTTVKVSFTAFESSAITAKEQATAENRYESVLQTCRAADPANMVLEAAL